MYKSGPLETGGKGVEIAPPPLPFLKELEANPLLSNYLPSASYQIFRPTAVSDNSARKLHGCRNRGKTYSKHFVQNIHRTRVVNARLRALTYKTYTTFCI
jgi:hypothetical protein